MLDILIDIIKAHSAEIGTFVVTTVIALLKRLFDKKKIKSRMIAKGIDTEVITAVMNGVSKKGSNS